MRYLAASQQWIKDYPSGFKDVQGKCHYDIFPEIPERWKEIHRRGLAGESLHSDEDKFVRKDGSIQWLRWRVQPWYELDGSIGGITMMAEEITVQREEARAKAIAEEAIRVAKASSDAKSFFSQP